MITSTPTKTGARVGDAINRALYLSHHLQRVLQERVHPHATVGGYNSTVELSAWVSGPQVYLALNTHNVACAQAIVAWLHALEDSPYQHAETIIQPNGNHTVQIFLKED